jgi:hypothetical protein
MHHSKKGSLKNPHIERCPQKELGEGGHLRYLEGGERGENKTKLILVPHTFVL